VDISARCGKGGQCGSGQIGMSRVDIAGVEISAPCGRGGQCRSGLISTVLQGWTMRAWKYRHHVVGVDNAGVDLSARYCKDGQCGK